MLKDKNIQKLNQASRVIDMCFSYKHYMEEIPAMTVGIIYKNEIIFSKGYGYVDINKTIPATTNTCFRIASISKIFTAISIMQLVESGKIKLDSTISTYLPWFNSINDPHLNDVTIRHLLTHTSGITRDGDTLHWIENNFPDLNHLKKYISNLKLPFIANSRWKYSNLGYSILGALIEQVSGITYEDYIQINICQKLGMTLTSSMLTEEIVNHLAIGYGRKIPNEKRKIFQNIETKAMAAATGLSSNVNDLLKFISAQFIGNTKLLSENSKQELRKIYWINKKDEIHQAIGLRSFKVGNRKLFYHSGGFQGYRCNISFDVTRNIGIVILTNMLGIEPRNYTKIAFNVINYIFKQPFTSNKLDFKKYEGIYRDIWDDSAIMTIGNNLVSFNPSSFEPLSHITILEHIKNNTFLIKGSDEVENAGELAYFEFDKNQNSKKVRWGATYANILKY
ncbi:MAG: serine hydrolase domain-containing protein [bacterium]|nr:serine hydrolase domain-containing protein [bacterium]